MSAFALGREAAPATLRAQLVWGCGEGWAAWLPMQAKAQASLSGADPSGKERMGSLLSIYKPDRGKSGGQSMGQSQQKLRFVWFHLGGGSSQIYQEKLLFFMSYEGGIWKMIYCHTDLIQTESLGPVPRSLHCVSGQHYSRLPCELEGGEEAAICQLQNVTLTPPCTTSVDTSPAFPFLHSTSHPNQTQFWEAKLMGLTLAALVYLCFCCSIRWILHHPSCICHKGLAFSMVLYSSPWPLHTARQWCWVFILLPTWVMCVLVSPLFPLLVMASLALWGPPTHPGSDWWPRAVLALHSLQGVCTLFIPALAKMNTIMISHGNGKVYLNNLTIKHFHW